MKPMSQPTDRFLDDSHMWDWYEITPVGGSGIYIGTFSRAIAIAAIEDGIPSHYGDGVVVGIRGETSVGNTVWSTALYTASHPG